MSYRLISLFYVLKTENLNFDYSYSATIQNGGLQLSEYFVPIGTRSGEQLQTLIDNAMQYEWLNKFESYVSQLESQGIDETHISRLKERGLSIKDQFDNFVKLKPLDRELQKEASKILNRRTIFLIPDYSPKPARDETKDVIKKIAEELKNKLANLDKPFNFSFLKHRGQNNSQFDNNAPGLMRTLIELLFIETSEQFSEQISRQYQKEGPLLMEGPTGTGKSVHAQLIAVNQNKKMVKINIAGITESLIESRMRGYKKGAFTDANKDEDGWFAKADKGILFLDEFQNASLESQTQLLDLLDPVSNDVYVSRVGDDNIPIRFNVKVILAVNKPVDELLADGKLREDLFYRIRHIIKFESLDAKLNCKAEENKFRFIRMLIYLYRWKSAPILMFDPRSSDSDWGSLFPEIDESIIPVLQKISWKGNYRQFERFITDLHWDNDNSYRCLFNADLLNTKVEEEIKLFGLGVSIQEKNSLDKKNLDRLIEVESLLLKNKFNIKNTINDLKESAFGKGLSSRPTLLRFLNDHYDQLKPIVKDDSKIVSFLKRERNNYS